MFWQQRAFINSFFLTKTDIETILRLMFFALRHTDLYSACIPRPGGGLSHLGHGGGGGGEHK